MLEVINSKHNKTSSLESITITKLNARIKIFNTCTQNLIRCKDKNILTLAHDRFIPECQTTLSDRIDIYSGRL